MSEAAPRPLLYVDTNVFIYAVQGVGDVASSLETMFYESRKFAARPVTSELTLAEIFCDRSMTPVTRRVFMNLIVFNRLIDLRPVSRDVLFGSAELRRSNPKSRLADAIHAHTAFDAGCTLLMTNDLRFGDVPAGTTLIKPDEDGVRHVLKAFHV